MTRCDKCGLPVTRENNALLLSIVVKRMVKHGVDYVPGECNALDLMAIVVLRGRHLLPVTEGDEVVCTGSPSRAQYLPGQPEDTRGFPLDENLRPVYDAAYNRLTSGRPI